MSESIRNNQQLKFLKFSEFPLPQNFTQILKLGPKSHHFVIFNKKSWYDFARLPQNDFSRF